MTACDSPTDLSYTGEGVVVNNDYAYTDSALVITLPTFSITPNYCQSITYTCSVEEKPGGSSALDCATGSITTFNSGSGAFTITLGPSNYAAYPPGVYKFKIRGSSGSTAP